MSKTHPLISALTGIPQNLYHIDGGVGAASSVKLINQLLAEVHITAAAEAMAFGAKLRLDTKLLYETIKTVAGGSWMFENRVPAMLTADWTPHSALSIFVKDLVCILCFLPNTLYVVGKKLINSRGSFLTSQNAYHTLLH
jgi:3-hydroxyisobutyrate dehydrogenase-like beta-hydroxyacid dehydrogenase